MENSKITLSFEAKLPAEISSTNSRADPGRKITQS